MTLPGGPADKLGNRYEKLWTVSELVRMLHGSAVAIRIEDPGVEKAEFVVTRGGHRELHQAKRSHPTGKWSLAALGATDVRLLQTIGKQLIGNNDRFVFASSSDARELAELCEAANHAESMEEFKRAFLAANERKDRFDRLCGYWACDGPTALELLRRIEIRSIGELDLEQKTRWGVQALFLADPRDVLAELQKIVDDSLHRTIRRQELVDQLAGRGYPLRHLISRENAVAAVYTATDRYLDGMRRKLIRGTLVPRASTGTLLSRLEEPPTDSVLTGRAGIGKTGCVIEIVEALRAREAPVLAFRLDRVLSASNTKDLGRRLDLEESPVLVLAAAAEIAERPGVLIIDQLDAVSTMSGRTSDALDIVERLLLEARGMRARVTIHTVVACREFDWKNDSRLRQLMPKSHAQVEVTEFTVDEVKIILADAAFDPALFRKRQLELLQLPQNLSLFFEAGFEPSRAPAFSSATELFERYWTEKRRAVQSRVAPAPDQWMEVIETLCDEMTAAQQLSVSREKLDRVPEVYLDQLASEGVLTFDGRRYGFGHESFFDYCFARVFFNRAESLVSFLMASEQHLFRRAQVRQVLAYLRDADRDRYLRELRSLLVGERIRPHIKDLAFSLLAEVTDPIEQEWSIWEAWTLPALKAIEEGKPNPNKLSALAWQRFLASPSWFAIADQRGIIEGWLASGNDRLANLAVNYLRMHQRHSPDRVVALLEPYADLGDEWAPRLRSLMEWVDRHTSRRFFDLFLRLVDNGTLDKAHGLIAVNSTFWSMLYDVGDNRPEWVPEALAHWLRRRVAIIRAAGEDLTWREILGYDHSAAMLFEKSSERNPAAFVEHVLPVVLEISEFAVTSATPPKRDAVWPILFKTDHPRGEDACLSALVGSVAALAREDAANLRAVIVELRLRDTHIANHLLLALYGGRSSRYADEAVSLLCDEPWRFECGFADSPNWCAMEVIRAMVPHCTPEDRARLEAVILGYVSAYERTKGGYKQAGWTQFALLSAIPTELRSTRANARFEELKRKFGKPEGAPRGIIGGWVKSPIEKDATDRMTDEHWLRAIAKYRSEDRVRSSGGELKGGAWQFAQALEARVKEEPERFARLSLRFPPDANPVYLERTLAALKGAAVASDLKLQVCRKAFAESRGPCGQSIADLMGSIEESLPEDAVEILSWLATEHEDPTTEAWQQDAGGGQTYSNGDIHTNGINTTRGRAADAIRDLILTDAVYVDRFRTTLDQMLQDQSVCVRSCVAGALRAVTCRDPALGMSLFRKLDLSQDRLLATDHVYHFILGGLREHLVEVRPIVERMLGSSEPEVCEAGARLASLSALINASAVDLADEAMRGSSRHRLGVAQVASAYIAVPGCRAWCEATLAALFDDDDADVMREAASCFHHLRDEPLESYGDLVAVFCDSRAFQEDSVSILYVLEESLGRLPGMTCVVCEKLLHRFTDEARDVQSKRFVDPGIVARLIFRTYQQHQNDEWTSRSLDLIDRICLERIPDAGHEFEQFER